MKLPFWVQVDALFLCHRQQKLLYLTVLFSQILHFSAELLHLSVLFSQILHVSAELLCLSLDRFNGGLCKRHFQLFVLSISAFPDIFK